jgi:hypothetical protein
MGMVQVEKLEDAARVFRQQLEEERQPVPEVQLWLISTGGFTDEVFAYVTSREDTLFSDYEGVNNIFKAFGSNYSIPMFAENDREQEQV